MHHLCTNQYEIAKLFFAPEKTDNSRKNKSHGYYICFWE